jgi:UDP:flavonoid glycosyltransferase YjiC (YdhE family)
MAQMMLLTRGTGGDVFPFVRIGAALKRRGHGVVLLSYSGFKGVAEKAGLPRVRAMIHHGGIGTLGLCLTYGVPQVGGDASLAACEFLESLAGERRLRAARS